LESQNAKNEKEIGALKRLNGVPLEEYQKLENQLRDLKNKCNDFKHASSMYELKMFNPIPGILPPPPNPNLMTQMALNKIRSDQDHLNSVVSGMNTYNKDRTNLQKTLAKSYPVPNVANSMISSQPSTLPNRYQSLSNFHVAGFSRNENVRNANSNTNNNKSMIRQLSIQASQQSAKRTLSLEDDNQSSTRSQTVVMSTTAIQEQINNLDASMEDPTLKSLDNDLTRNYEDDFEILEVDLDEGMVKVNFMQRKKGTDLVFDGDEDSSWEVLTSVGPEVKLDFVEECSTQRNQYWRYKKC
jgi:hypothetical protein